MNPEYEFLCNSNDNSLKSNEKILFYDRLRYGYFLEDMYENLMELDCIFIKGEVLSLMAYGEKGVRQSKDIDILVPKKNLKKLERKLNDKGYFNQIDWKNKRAARIMCISLSHQLMSFHKKKRGINIEIDVNFDIFLGEYEGQRIDMCEYMDKPVKMDLFGYEVNVLCPEKALIQLILHHYKEMNSLYVLSTKNPFNYMMYRDVYYLWKNNLHDINLDEFYTRCSNYGIVPYVYYVLFFTNKIFDDKRLEKFVSRFETDEGIAALSLYGLKDSERRQWNLDFKFRLLSDDVWSNIQKEMSSQDKKKIEVNREIFL